jgi:CheY-like chemotaxis protein
VLFVEDNPGDVRLVKEALADARSAEFQLTHVQNLHDGLRRLARHKFDVILLDLMLEETPRLGALFEIYEQSATVPVVILTGLEDRSVRRWARKEGARDYLIKGAVNPERLATSLLEAAEHRPARRGHSHTGRGP